MQKERLFGIIKIVVLRINIKNLEEWKLQILGHRGIPVLYKENTILSLIKAIEFGANGVETDVRLTKDGIPVLLHDDNLCNFAGVDVKLKDITLKELRTFSYQGLNVPTLEEFLKSVPSGKCLNIEIKEYEAGEITVSMCEKLYVGEKIYSSFNHLLINELKEKYPNLKFGYLFDEEHVGISEEEIINLFDKNTFSAHLPIVGLQEFPEILIPLIHKLKEKNIKIVLWTVNSKSEIEKIRNLIDYVITDDVRIFLGSND